MHLIPSVTKEARKGRTSGASMSKKNRRLYRTYQAEAKTSGTDVIRSSSMAWLGVVLIIVQLIRGAK